MGPSRFPALVLVFTSVLIASVWCFLRCLVILIFVFHFLHHLNFICASSGGYDAFQWSWQRRKGRHWLRGVFGFDTGKKSVSVLSKLDYKFRLEMVSKCNKRKFCKTRWRQICHCYSSTFGCHLWSVVKHTPSKMESIVCKQQRKEILSLPHSTQLFWIYFWTGHCLSLGKKGGSEEVFKGSRGGEGDSRRQQVVSSTLYFLIHTVSLPVSAKNIVVKIFQHWFPQLKKKRRRNCTTVTLRLCPGGTYNNTTSFPGSHLLLRASERGWLISFEKEHFCNFWEWHYKR